MRAGPFRTGPDGIYRASPLFELIPYGRLSESDREGAAAAPETELFGIVRRRDGGGASRVVDATAALLLLSLGEPGRLPPCLRADRWLAEAARLVLDGALEMWDGAEFVSGGAALERGSPTSGREPVRESVLAALSRRAIRHATELVRWVAESRRVIAIAEARPDPGVTLPRSPRGWESRRAGMRSGSSPATGARGPRAAPPAGCSGGGGECRRSGPARWHSSCT
jgi:hypothetical protein